MEENQNFNNRPVNPRRRKRSKAQIFKETYLPTIIAGLAMVLILIFIIGSVTRSIQRKNKEKQERYEASIAASIAKQELDSEAATLSDEAAQLAASFDYERAISTIDSFSGNIRDYPELSDKKMQYEAALGEMVLWDDPSKVVNLSFQLLIADPSRSFKDAKYGTSYNKNFITTEEFSNILQQLYENDYILISLTDVSSQLLLPKNKKPLILTQTQVNYYTYMTDSNGDKLPDAGGAGFASKLISDADGNLTCEMVDATGQTVTGAYDLVPILEAFIETHPDFSYKGARAILAVTGYDGLFGYRTSSAAKDFFGDARYQEEISGATQITQALRNAGYEIACYTYENVAYGSYNAAQITSDLDKWRAEASPILGVVDTLVYARNSDIAGRNTTYSGEKFTVLSEFGFANYLGFCTDGTPWFSKEDDFLRQGRLLVSGSNLAHHADWFSDIFDPQTVLDPSRGTIPS